MCIAPITLAKDTRLTYSLATRVVPCGSCVLCLKKRVNQWSFRLYEEMKVSKNPVFLTLTYDDENLPVNTFDSWYIDYETGEIDEWQTTKSYLKKTDFQKFMKRLRKAVPKTKVVKDGKTRYHSNIKYYACGEYGNNNGRAHYHAIVFNLPKDYTTDYRKIESIWALGRVHIGTVTMGSIKYVCKYINKRIDKKNTNRPCEFSVMSKNLGIAWLDDKIKSYYKRNLGYLSLQQSGEKVAIPRYYKEKMFTRMELHEVKLMAIGESNRRFREVFNNSFINLNTWKKDKQRLANKLNRSRNLL